MIDELLAMSDAEIAREIGLFSCAPLLELKPHQLERWAGLSRQAEARLSTPKAVPVELREDADYLTTLAKELETRVPINVVNRLEAIANRLEAMTVEGGL